ncbi:MAG: AsmA-like C-terminal region-containing protein [Sphingomonadales bacterium]
MKWIRRGLWTASALALFLIVGALLLAVRMAEKPLGIGFADAYVREQAAELLPGYQLNFETPTIFWNRAQSSLDLQLINIDIKKNDGTPLARLPRLGIALGLKALFDGRLEARRIDIFGPELRLSWSAENLAKKVKAFLAGDKAGGELLTGERPAMLEFIEELLQGGGQSEGLGNLQTVRIEHGEIWLTESGSGTVWLFPDTSLAARRTPHGLAVELELTLEAPGAMATVAAIMTPKEDGAASLEFEFDGLDPGALSKTVGLDHLFGQVMAPFGGKLGLQISPEGVEAVDFDFSMGQGRLHLADIFEAEPLIRRASFTGSFTAGDLTLRLDKFEIDLTDGRLSGGLILNLPLTDGGKPTLSMEATLREADIRHVLAYWPPKLGAGGRRWVNLYIPKGQVISAHATAHIQPGDWGKKPLPARALRLDFRFRDVEAHYRKPMPPLIDAKGFGVLAGPNLDISVEEGSTDGIPVLDTEFRARNLGDKRRHTGEVLARIVAPLDDVLRLIDYKPLEITSRNNINPETLDGEVSATLNIKFPLNRTLAREQIRYRVDAVLSEFEIPALFRDGGLTGGLLEMQINNQGLSASGRVHLKEIPFALDWRQRFGKLPAGVYPTTYDLDATLSAENLERFGLPAVGRMLGTARARLRLHGSGTRLVEGGGVLDMFRAEVNAPRFGWKKEANTEADLTFSVSWTTEEMRVQNISLDSESLKARASLTVARGTGLLKWLRFSNLETPGTKLSLDYQVAGLEVPSLSIRADRFDASFFLTRILVPDTKGRAPLNITLTAKEASGLNGIKFKDISLSAFAPEGEWLKAKITGLHDTGEAFSVDLSASESERTFAIRSGNAGALGLAMDVFPNGLGGKLVLEATVPGLKGLEVIEGRLKISDLRVVRSSALLSALSEQKPRGLDNIISEGGMTFKRVRLPFRLENGVIDITKGRANGPAIGFTLEGQLDRKRELISINGIIVPAFALNSLLGKVPIVGSLLTGGEGEGMFAITYRVEGGTDSPKVTVNPLSVLAPGVLRKIFEGPKGELPPIAEPNPDKSKSQP